ncbi:dTDP-glucose 4,6-dehydratase [Bradyrhizobium sp. CCBAU 45384]|uniref:dTDP-glucose 4,6-dehydratase n=1 Tax=Bradyrhizobium sp. CCBAU 45384 TaxID=858428 RepID=UPI002305F70E|nr:GDP-mannose 4,6-dehydratase [Bradyrhizobium sp. CCBAU 45384]MDA9409897.1 hypothetical protein [Bradyrhizobium sp. CCBAU 45384]
MRVLVTGGAGFIGSAVCRQLVLEAGVPVLNVDKLTYAANLASLTSVERRSCYRFEQHDICDPEAFEFKPLPLYGDGSNVRDWLYVADHAAGLIRLLSDGRPGEKYNFGGDSERSNLEVVTQICDVLDRVCPGAAARRSLITFVPDRPGHDGRYAIDASKAHRELGWQPTRSFEQGLAETVEWYLASSAWWQAARNSVYDGSRLGLPVTQH